MVWLASSRTASLSFTIYLLVRLVHTYELVHTSTSLWTPGNVILRILNVERRLDSSLSGGKRQAGLRPWYLTGNKGIYAACCTLDMRPAHLRPSQMGGLACVLAGKQEHGVSASALLPTELSSTSVRRRPARLLRVVLSSPVRFVSSPSSPQARLLRLFHRPHLPLNVRLEKVNKVADFKDIERAEAASYPESSHAHSFVLQFFDKSSSITLAAKSFGVLSTRQSLPLHPASSAYALSWLLLSTLSVFLRPLLTCLACQTEECRSWMQHILQVLEEIYFEGAEGGGRADDEDTEEAKLEVLRNEVAVLKTKVANALNASLGTRSRRPSSAEEEICLAALPLSSIMTPSKSLKYRRVSSIMTACKGATSNFSNKYNHIVIVCVSSGIFTMSARSHAHTHTHTHVRTHTHTQTHTHKMFIEQGTRLLLRVRTIHVM